MNLPIFKINCIKLRNFRAMGGGVPGSPPPKSANAYLTFFTAIWHSDKVFSILLILIFCRYYVRPRTKYTRLDVVGVPVGWFHAVLIYQEDQITVYHNKILQSGLLGTGTTSKPPGSGTVMIGRGIIDRVNYWGSVIVDELAMWNRALSETEVAQLYDMFS